MGHPLLHLIIIFTGVSKSSRFSQFKVEDQHKNSCYYHDEDQQNNYPNCNTNNKTNWSRSYCWKNKNNNSVNSNSKDNSNKEERIENDTLMNKF